MTPNLIDCVIHWKKKLDKNPEEEIILNVIRKLSKIPITVEILEATHIGKAIRNLSKRDGVIGEKAKILLNKWRKIMEKTIVMQSVKDSKQPSVSSNEKKSSTDHNSIQQKTAHHHKIDSSKKHQDKHKKNLSYHKSSKQTPEEPFNVDCSPESSHSFSEYNEKKSFSNMDFDTNPEGIEVFSSDNKIMKRKNSSSGDFHELPSMKRKLAAEEHVETNIKPPKKFKSENHSSSHSEEKKKHSTHKNKDSLFNHNNEKEKSNSKSENCSATKQNSTSHIKKAVKDNSKKKNITESEISKPKVKIHSSEEFTSTNEFSFEDCLGFNDIVTAKIKKSSKTQSAKKPSSNSDQFKNKPPVKKATSDSSFNKVDVSKKSSHSSKEKVSDNMPKQALVLDVPKSKSSFSPVTSGSETSSQSLCKSKNYTNDDVIKFTSSRKGKTAIYSGRKSFLKHIPTLVECCYRVLGENIDAVSRPMKKEEYHILRPILEKFTPFQLSTIEKYNPHLLDETNEAWEILCKRDYKSYSPLEHETWRDVYLRGYDEEEERLKNDEKRLKNITAHISASMSKATPVRQVKLAFVDSFAKPPRDVARRQAKNGLVVVPDTHALKAGLSSKVSAKKHVITPASSEIKQAENNILVKAKTEGRSSEKSSKGSIKSAAPVSDPCDSNKDINELTSLALAAKKPKVAPLMAKTLKTMKQCFRR